MRNSVSAALVGLFLAGAPSAWAADDSILTRGNALLQAGHPDQAYGLLNPAADQNAGNADFDYALGVAALDSGHRGEAIIALQRALALRPDFAQARAEIARAYAMAGDTDTARREFNTVAGDPSIPDPVRRQFLGLVDRFDKVAHPGWSLAGYAQGGAGYDSNVNSATSLTQISIPLFSFLGPASLSSAAQQQGDGFGAFEGGISADYGFDRQSHLFASLQGSEHATFNNSAFDQTAGGAALGYSFTFPTHDTVSLTGQGQQFWLGGKGYQRALGGVAQYTHAFSNGRALSFMGQFFDLRYRTDPARDAKRYGGSITFSDTSYFTTVQGGYEAANATTSRYLSNYFAGVRAGLEQPLLPNLKLFANAAYEHRGYQSADPLFLVSRSDNQFDVSAGLRWHVFGPASLVPQVTYTHNQSNIALYEYDRVTAGLSLRVEF